MSRSGLKWSLGCVTYPWVRGQYSPNCRPRHETFNHLVLLAKFTRPYEFFLPWHSCFLPFLSLCGLCRFVAYLNGTSWGSHITVNGFMVASYAMHNTSHWLPAYEHYGSICALKSFLDISLNVSRAHFTLSPKDERTAAILTRNYDVCDGVIRDLTSWCLLTLGATWPTFHQLVACVLLLVVTAILTNSNLIFVHFS